MMMYYTLSDRTPVPCSDYHEWAKWFQNADRHVAKDTVQGILVSTVFLGLDHNFARDSQPILFETMAFNETGEVLEMQERYTTWGDAELGHRAIAEGLKRRLPV